VTDHDIRALLRERGAPAHIVEGGAEGLIHAWRRFVEQVEEGYPMGLDDYRNDLDIRTLIEITGLADRVESEDRRFRALLIHTEREIWESDVPGAFWVRGYPANASGELSADLC
jgi:hypothetical protein